MAKFHFRLNPLLQYKEQIEEDKKTEFGKAVQKLEKQKIKLLQVESEEAQILEDSKNNKLSSIDVKMNKMIIQYTNYLSSQKSFIQKKVEEEKEVVEAKKEELLQAMKERKMLELLKEKAWDNYKKDVLEEEQKLIDELVSFKYKNRSSE